MNYATYRFYLSIEDAREGREGSGNKNRPKRRQTRCLGHRYVFLFVISILTYPFRMARRRQLQQQRPDRYDECNNSDNEGRQAIKCVYGHHHHSEMENGDGDRDRDREMGAKRWDRGSRRICILSPVMFSLTRLHLCTLLVYYLYESIKMLHLNSLSFKNISWTCV